MRILGIGDRRELAVEWVLGRDSRVVQKWLAWDAKNPKVSRAMVLSEAKTFRPDFALVWTQVEPLVAGIADVLESIGIPTVGPGAYGATLESSKVFACEFARRSGILIPDFQVFSGRRESKTVLNRGAQAGEPLPVLKPNGLPASKGVRLPHTLSEALEHVDYLMEHYGSTHLHQKRIHGRREFNLYILSDGKNYKLLPHAQSCKNAFEGDRKANHAGAFSPVPGFPPELISRAVTEIVEPTLNNLEQPYRGFLNIDVIEDFDGKLYLLDYNCRMAYPDEEAILPRIASSFAGLMSAAAAGKLDQEIMIISEQAAVCVVLLARGWPGPIQPGAEVFGIDEARKAGCLVFPIGVSAGPVHRILGNTGRAVLVVGRGQSVEKARLQAYEGVTCIHWDGMWYSRDVALNI